MANRNPRRILFVAAAGGLAGFFVILLARTIAILVAVASTNLIFGGSNFSPGASLILFGFVPIFVIIGAGIPAWVLGATLGRGLLGGMIAMGVIVFIRVFGDPNYSPFNDRETLEFVSSICVAMLASMIGREWLQWGKLAVVFILMIAFLVLKFVIPGNEIELGNVSVKVGLVVSLLAWILLPLVVAFFTLPEKT